MASQIMGQLGNYVGSNVFALFLVLVAAKWPRIARLLVSILFIGAGAWNLFASLTMPGFYVATYGPLATSPYRAFIYGPFAANPGMFVVPIALGELAIGTLAAGAGAWVKLSAVGVTAFMIGLAPLGVGGAFPFSVFAIIAAGLLFRQDFTTSLFEDLRSALFGCQLIRRVLLACGIVSSLLYLAMNIAGAMLYPGYDVFSQEVSELSAIGAPTRALWVPLGMLWAALVVGFGMGVWLSSGRNRALRTVGALLMAYGIFSMWWPPMHQREVIAAGGSTLTDTLHLVWAGITVLTMFLYIAFGAAALGTRFRWYSIGTAVLLVAFGILTGTAVGGISTGQPTPWAGVIERINIFMDMQWVLVLSLALLRRPAAQAATHAQFTPGLKAA